MRRIDLIGFSIAGALVAAIGATGTSAHATEMVEKRGDFWYDAGGKPVAAKHVDPPADFPRAGTSWLEKSTALGIELPQRSAQLEPRRTLAKPASVDARDVLELDKLIVKFTETGPVRLRGGSLRRSGAAMPEVGDILSRHPSMQVRRLFQVEERILEENKDAGERISGRELPDLDNFYLFTFPDRGPTNAAVANELLALDGVEMAYFQSPGEPAACSDITPTTPLWEADQFYRDPAPDGIDIEAAWAYDPAGDGAGTGFWIVDCEWEWCYDHEDIDIQISDVVNGDTPGAFTVDHGTAVLGIIGACDNDYGVTGLTPDVTLKMSDFDSDATTAETVQAAVNNLFVGEIALMEIQIWGPPSGLPCSCNCGQFHRVPVEWDGAVFAVLQTATANGILIVEAAGNGSMDLDSPIYGGAFDRTLLDSGAILVGAGLPTSHDPECWTNFGSRVDVHAYGSALYSCGYADLQNGTGCLQDYTTDFGGTSGASPIIVGACASLQGIANAKWGFDLSPWEMRDLLQIGATPQGTSTRHIGPMPDLAEAIPALAPDLVTSYTPAGWSYPIVPRSTDDATGSSALVDAGALPGNASGTYWSWATRNQSAYSAVTASTTTELTLDDTHLLSCGSSHYFPDQWQWCGNSGGIYVVKGGRHTARSEADYLDAQDERSETNNAWAHQYIWSGLPLASGAPVTRTSDPPAVTTGFGPWYNGEGVSGTTGIPYWYAFAVLPTDPGEDYDIRLCVEEPGNDPVQGFGAHVAYSATPAGEMAYVVFDRNNVPSGTYWASILNLSDATGNRIVEFSGDGGVITTSGTFGPYTMNPGDLVELHEILLPAGAQTRIQVEVLSGSADFGISLHGGGSGYYTKASTVAGGSADAAGPGEDEYVLVEAPVADYHGLVVWKNGPGELAAGLTYNVIVGQDPNLVPTTPAGWYGPVVPRASTDATPANVPLPSLLIGNAPATSFNWAILNEGPNDAPSSWSSAYVDDDVRFSSFSGTLAPGATHLTLNTAFIPPEAEVRGGRHHVRVTADRLGAVQEFDETDNSYVEWFVWTPQLLADGPSIPWPVPSPAAPTGFGPYFSGDGFRTSHVSSRYWTAVGVMPVSPTDDYDVRMYDPSTGSKNGFGGYHTWSNDGVDGAPDFAVVNYNVAPDVDLDYSVLNWSGAASCLVQEADAPYEGPIVAGPNDLGTFTMAPSDFLALHEFLVPAEAVDQSVTIIVEPVAGGADLDVRLFDAETDYANKLTASASATSAGPGETEILGPVSFPTTDYRAILIHRKNADQLGTTEQYRLVVNVGGAVDAPPISVVPTAFALAAPQPNPFAGRTAIRYDVPSAAGAETRVTLYDIRGRQLRSLVDGTQPAGRHVVHWDGRNDAGNRVGAGVYFVRMTAGTFRSTRKITLLR